MSRYRMTVRRVGFALLIAALVGTVASGAKAADDDHSFHSNGPLGTSLDLTVRGVTKAQADACHQAVLAEVKRLEKILSTWIPDSEISKLQAAKGSFTCSPDLFAVLQACDQWRKRTGGAFNPHVGEVADLWKQGEKDGAVPSDTALARAVKTLATPAWRISSSSRTVSLLRPPALRVDGLAKGYVLDNALTAAAASTPHATGILLNIGGDIVAWGSRDSDKNSGWNVGLADPLHPADNSKPLTTIRLVNRAVASSGGYERFLTIDSKRYSYIIDPRTGQPARAIAGATVVAATGTSADAVATTLCVLEPKTGVMLVNYLPATECLIVGPDGTQYPSRAWKSLELAKTGSSTGTGANTGTGTATAGKTGWPEGYSCDVRLSIRRNRKRPMVAAWIADSKNTPVKMLALWGKSKYFKKMTRWYSLGDFRYTARSVTRSSRSAGTYTLTWDGTDSKGKPVPAGTYTVMIELSREKGTHVTMSAPIACGTKKTATAQMKGNAESDGADVRYGPAKR